MNEFLAWLIGVVGILLPGFGVAPVPSWNGYVEADYLYVAAQTPGQISEIAVVEGQWVEEGDLLFVLASTQQQALLAAAKAQVDAARANAANLETGSRADEQAVIRAALAKAEADLGLASTSLARSEKLFSQGLIPQAKLDQDRTVLASAEAQVSQLRAQLRVSELPAREAQLLAAEANLATARANAQKAAADLEDRSMAAPVAAQVERLFFVAGEMAPAGVPVVALRTAGALRVKFYIPEPDLPRFALGDPLAVTCDGCPAGLTAHLSHIASEPQFTPPILYSRDERRRLTFLAEAVLDPDSALHPGQPVSVGRRE